jgi:hypothetical protein
MIHIAEDKNRRDITIGQDQVKTVLPAWYQEDNEKLIQLLEAYYDYMDTDEDHGFSTVIRQLHHMRDINSVDTKYLDELIKEIGNGLQSSSFFQKPRLMAKLLAGFYQSKGTLVSAEGFFRGFFGEEVSIEYPKDQIFIVGQDQIGFDSQKFIQDNRLYQIFSILIKVGLSTQDYENLYKKFVHPAGFYFAGQVISEGVGTLTPAGFFGGDSNDIYGIAETISYVSEATLTMVGDVVEMTALLESDGVQLRAGINQTVAAYANDPSLLVSAVNTYYNSIIQMITPNSYTFDDSSNTYRPDLSMTLETMDNDMFTRYIVDITESSI